MKIVNDLQTVISFWIDSIEVWTDIELESSILFKVPKEKNSYNNERVSKGNSNKPLQLINRIIGSNNAKDNKENDNTERNLNKSIDKNQFQINTNDTIPQENDNDSNSSI